MSLGARVATSAAEVAELAPRWEDLARRAACRSPFQSPAWVSAWLAHLGCGAEPLVIEVRDGDRTVGVVPLARTAGNGAVRFAGCPLNDRNGAVAAPSDLGPVWSAALGALADAVPGATLEVEDLAPEDAAVLAGAAVEPLAPTPSPVLPLSGDRARGTFTRKHLQNLRRQERALAAEHGPLAFWVDRGDALLAEDLVAFCALRRSRWRATGELGRLAPVERGEELDAFLVAWARGPAAGGTPALARLFAGDRCAAAHLCVEWGGTVLVYMTAHDPALRRHGPGTLCHLATIDWAIREGRLVYDFGRGDEPYKYALGARPRDLPGVRISLGPA
ncbi:MAG TPA: GNAT family N-acetyltransferase [Acidimicrobiales bacterium]|jgi:CelD/BcsL family acetyltransferase involved in cellulose biosynthesis